MSIESLDFLTDRLKEEFQRVGLSGAEVARRIGEKNANRLRQVTSNRQRMSTEMLAKMSVLCGIDGEYVLTGERSGGVDIDMLMKVIETFKEVLLLSGIEPTPEQSLDILMDVFKVMKKTGQVPARDAVETIINLNT